MTVNYLPRFEDYFQSTRRGHGSTHRDDRTDKHGVVVRKGSVCVADGCVLKSRTGKGDAHTDKAANIEDWKADRGMA